MQVKAARQVAKSSVNASVSYTNKEAVADEVRKSADNAGGSFTPSGEVATKR